MRLIKSMHLLAATAESFDGLAFSIGTGIPA
jgi:hypothetical protein